MSKTFVERVKDVADPDDFRNNSYFLDTVRPDEQENVFDCIQTGLHLIEASVRMAPFMGTILERLTKVKDVESEENRRILWQQYVALIQATQTKS